MKILLLVLLFPILSLAQLNLNPSPISGEIQLTSSQMTINFTNASSSAMTTSLSVDTNSGGVAISTNRCASIKAQQTCYVIISFPNYGKLRNQLSVSLKNGLQSLASLKYNPINPVAESSSFSSPSLSLNSFDQQTIYIDNQTSSTKTYSPSFSGTDASKYSIVLNRCVNVPATTRCSLVIKLNPQQAGSYSASLSEAQVTGSMSLSSTITGSTVGVVSPPSYSVSVSPSSIDFGTVKYFGNSSARNITITNNSSVSISPVIDLSSNMGLVLNRCTNLAPAQSCSIAVAMNPSSSTLNGALTGSVSIKPISSGSAQLISTSGLLSVSQANGGICPLGQHYENSVCVGAAIGFLSCQEIKDDTPSSPSGYYDLVSDNGTFNVYCDMSDAQNAYMEIFDIDREPGLTNQQILDKINLWSNFSISLTNLLRDGSGRVAWTQNNSNLSLIYGQSISFDRLSSTKLKFTGLMGSGGAMGYMTLHSSNQTNCNPNTSLANGCMQTGFRYLGNLRFIMGDLATSQPQLYTKINGVDNIQSNALTSFVLENIPSSVFLTQSGRIEESSSYISPYVYISKLFIKGSVVTNASLPKVSCAAAKASGITTSGYVMLDADGSSGPIPPSRAYCNMSGAGVATITETCNYARIYGQKNSNNDTGSGSYLIDLDGSGSYSEAAQYCDMSQAAWNNNEGGYTLVGVFNTNSTITPVTTIADIIDTNVYLIDQLYSEVYSKSSEVILKSNRGDSSEIIYRVSKSIIPNINCKKNDVSILPMNLAPGNSPTTTGSSTYWFWGENGCDLNGGDYSIVGLTNPTGFAMFNLYPGMPAYIQRFDMNSNTYSSVGNTPHPNGSYQIDSKSSGESIYIYVK